MAGAENFHHNVLDSDKVTESLCSTRPRRRERKTCVMVRRMNSKTKKSLKQPTKQNSKPRSGPVWAIDPNPFIPIPAKW